MDKPNVVYQINPNQARLLEPEIKKLKKALEVQERFNRTLALLYPDFEVNPHVRFEMEGMFFYTVLPPANE